MIASDKKLGLARSFKWTKRACVNPKPYFQPEVTHFCMLYLFIVVRPFINVDLVESCSHWQIRKTSPDDRAMRTHTAGVCDGTHIGCEVVWEKVDYTS